MNFGQSSYCLRNTLKKNNKIKKVDMKLIKTPAVTVFYIAVVDFQSSKM